MPKPPGSWILWPCGRRVTEKAKDQTLELRTCGYLPADREPGDKKTELLPCGYVGPCLYKRKNGA